LRVWDEQELVVDIAADMGAAYPEGKPPRYGGCDRLALLRADERAG
jgi:hypothetical protein